MNIRFVNYWSKRKKSHYINALIMIEHMKLGNSIGYRHIFYFTILNLGFIITGKSVKY